MFLFFYVFCEKGQKMEAPQSRRWQNVCKMEFCMAAESLRSKILNLAHQSCRPNHFVAVGLVGACVCARISTHSAELTGLIRWL